MTVENRDPWTGEVRAYSMMSAGVVETKLAAADRAFPAWAARPLEERGALEKPDVGLLYVLEGSSLGARLLAKRAEALGFSADFGARHLFSQARNFSNWRAFSDRMENVRGYDDRAAARWANTAFDYARDAFESAMNADQACSRPDQL